MFRKNIIKIIVTIILLISTSLISIFLGIKMYVNSFIKDNYTNRVNIWSETNKNLPSNSTVFIGDSITEYFMLDEFFLDKTVINRGIYGDTTTGVLNRLNESVYSINPYKVFILIGTNDLDKTTDTPQVIGERIKSIVNKIKLKCPNTKIYIQSIYPVNKTTKNSTIGKRNNESIIQINKILSNISNGQDIIYIDVYSKLIDKNGNLSLNYTIEGLHLTPKGYKKVYDILNPYV